MSEEERQLLLDLTESLQETRILAVVSTEGDPWYAQDGGIDVEGVYFRARDVLERAEEWKDDAAADEPGMGAA